MRRILTCMAITVLTLMGGRAEAQSSGTEEMRWYLAAGAGCGVITGDAAPTLGARIGFETPYGLLIGAALKGFPPAAELEPHKDSSLLEGGYGGFDSGYVLELRNDLHLVSLLLIGAGSLAASDAAERSDLFAVVEPSLYLEFGMNRRIRAALGGAYRWTRGIDDFGGLSDTDISGFALELLLRFSLPPRGENRDERG